MTAHSNRAQRRGTGVEGSVEGGAARVEVGGVKGALAELRTPEPGAVVYSGKAGRGQVTGPPMQNEQRQITSDILSLTLLCLF